MRSLSLRTIAEASLIAALCSASVRGEFLSPPSALSAWPSPSGESFPFPGAEPCDQFVAERLPPVTAQIQPGGSSSGVALVSGETLISNSLSASRSSCCPSTETGNCHLSPECEACPNRGMFAFLGYDSWRGISDGGWANYGIHTGVNFGSRLGAFSDWTGIGLQVGGSAGAANWAGTDYRLSRQDDAQTQGFFTYGLFRKPQGDSAWSAAVVHDWMFNDNYGLFAEDPTMGQWRAQAGYALSDRDEAGLWGTWRLQSDTLDVPFFGPTTWRAINQINTYWHHKWQAGGPDTWLWLGLPENDRLNGDGSLGDYLVGALANCPFGERIALYATVSYMHQSAAAGPAGATEDAWNLTTGLSFYPARTARTRTVAGQCWMPQLPVANNGTFLVDVSQGY